MNGPDRQAVDAVLALVNTALREDVSRPLVLGLCGAQGSGKTTLAQAISRRLETQGLGVATLSLDDLYLSRARRARLARDVHPLFATRGPPGTHDVALGLAILEALDRGERVRLPRFDKARDEPSPEDDWPFAPAQCDVLVFEGWCVGAVAQEQAELAFPANALEAAEDPALVWRGFANRQLDGPYRALFARIDRLVLLAAPGFDVVAGWRGEQESALRASAAPGSPGLMDDTALVRFVAHYERLTRHILKEMPARADVVLRLDGARRVVQVSRKEV